MTTPDNDLPPIVTRQEREAWWQLFDSVAAEMGLDLQRYDPRHRDRWLDCCLMPGPLHADDCPVRLAGHGAHRE